MRRGNITQASAAVGRSASGARALSHQQLQNFPGVRGWVVGKLLKWGPWTKGVPSLLARPPAPLPGAASTERPASSSSSGSGTRCEGAARSMRLAVAGWRAAERTKTRGAAPWLVRGAGTARLHVPAEPPQPKLGPAARFNYPAREEGGGRARRRRGRGVPGPHSSQAASQPWISGATPSRPRPGGGAQAHS